MSKKMNRNINLTEGSIPKGIIAFAIPLLLTNFLQQLYNTADLMIVGRFAGKNPMAAVGATGPVSNLLIGLFLGLTTGASVIISLYYGSNDREALKRSVGCSYFLGLMSGLNNCLWLSNNTLFPKDNGHTTRNLAGRNNLHESLLHGNNSHTYLQHGSLNFKGNR